MAGTLWCLGFPAQAEQRSQEALALAEALAHPYSIAVARFGAASLQHHRRTVPAVQAQADAILSLARAQGFPVLMGYGTCWRGWALAMQGQGAAALAELQQGLDAVLATGQTLAQPFGLLLHAEAVGHAGQGEAGLHLLAEALAACKDSGQSDVLAEVYRLQGELFLGAGGREGGVGSPPAMEAEACWHQALELARRQQAKSWELRAALSLARLWHVHCGALTPLNPVPAVIGP